MLDGDPVPQRKGGPRFWPILWRFLATFLRHVFSAIRVQQVSDLHSKFALRPHHVWKCGIDIQSPTAEIRRGKKKIQITGQKHNGLPIT